LDFYDIARFLIIGAFIAAALQTFIPRQAFFSVASGSVAAIALMMVLAVVLNLCSEADAFIAASLAPIGIPFTAQLAFMVLGPMLDLKLILMYMSVFTRKMIIILSLSTLTFVFMAMLFMEGALTWL
ncbi:MAG: permease, partial [Desulfobacterales bacterium]|nr:permease [Desulfobacterales bacterium]